MNDKETIKLIQDISDLRSMLNTILDRLDDIKKIPNQQSKLEDHEKRICETEKTCEDYKQNKWTYKGIVITVSCIMLLIQIFGGYINDKFIKSNNKEPVKIELIYPTNYPFIITNK